MSRGSTLFLKTVIVMLGLAVLALCVFVLPEGIRQSTNWLGYRPLLLGMYLPAIPFYIGLYQGIKLLRLIDNDQAFSTSAINSLTIIRLCGIVIGTMYLIGIPYIFYLAQMDDAPGVALIGLVFAFTPLVIAVFAAVIQRLLQNTVEIKTENDLTV